ncbi:folylpolyglutamate synthase, partial [Cladophialophora psammophila CBS 110553]
MNFLDKLVITGITTIGLDYIARLGLSVENVPWHKAEIFKSGAPAFSSSQDQVVVSILYARAAEKGGV